MTMIEKVANAIFEEMAKQGIIAINWNTNIAKAAINALREPNEIDPKILQKFGAWFVVTTTFDKPWDAAIDQIIDPE